MITLHRIAAIELALCWVAWFYPFVRRAIRLRGRRPAVTVRRARWGLLLQTASYFVASPRVGAASTAALIASLLAGPVAVALAWAAVAHLGKQWRIEAGLYHDHELVRSGPYRLVRHPVYASMILMLLAHGLVLTTWPLLPALALMIAGTEIRVRAEESVLAPRFGKEFEAYRRAVPAYLPLLRQPLGPRYTPRRP